jgi:WD40 repeat protein
MHQQHEQGIRLITPTIVGHCNADKNTTRNAIYSCDIQKGGKRIATGGGGKLLSTMFLYPFSCSLITSYLLYHIITANHNHHAPYSALDSFVKVWQLSALLATPDICDTALQATLCNHTKSVNVVRWSKDGQFLASGSDDCYILVYKLDSSAHNISSQPFGSSTVKNKVYSLIATILIILISN